MRPTQYQGRTRPMQYTQSSVPHTPPKQCVQAHSKSTCTHHKNSRIVFFCCKGNLENKQAPLAQLAEQLTLNQWVLGSSPRGRTSKKIPLILRNRRDFCVPLEMQFLGLRSLCSALFLMVRAACFLRAYAGAPVTRTLRFLLASLRGASV